MPILTPKRKGPPTQNLTVRIPVEMHEQLERIRERAEAAEMEFNLSESIVKWLRPTLLQVERQLAKHDGQKPLADLA